MNAIHAMYPEIARIELDQRLRDADHTRRRRLARHRFRTARRRSHPRVG